MGPDTVALVDRQGAPVARDKFGVAASRRRRDQRVVCRAAGDPTVGQSDNESLVGSRIQPQEWLGKSGLNRVALAEGLRFGRRQGLDGACRMPWARPDPAPS